MQENLTFCLNFRAERREKKKLQLKAKKVQKNETIKY